MPIACLPNSPNSNLLSLASGGSDGSSASPISNFSAVRHWHASQSFSSLSNRFVNERLRKIDPAAQPFSCVELCNELLGRRAQNCGGSIQFGAVIRSLEMMLMWSFYSGISLLSWDAGLAVEFLKFWKHPPATWTASTTHLRFIFDADLSSNRRSGSN